MERLLLDIPSKDFFDDDFVTKVCTRLPVLKKKEKETKRPNTRSEGEEVIVESVHPYPHNANTFLGIQVDHAISYEITFDSRSKTESGCDYIVFYKNDQHSEIWGESKYTGGEGSSSRNFPGTDGRPPLIIPATHFVLHFRSDGSCNDWGYKIQIIPILALPKSVVPAINVDDLADIFLSSDFNENSTVDIYSLINEQILEDETVLANDPLWLKRHQILDNLHSAIAKFTSETSDATISNPSIAKDGLQSGHVTADGGSINISDASISTEFSWSLDEDLFNDNSSDVVLATSICASVAAISGLEGSRKEVALNKLCTSLTKIFSKTLPALTPLTSTSEASSGNASGTIVDAAVDERRKWINSFIGTVPQKLELSLDNLKVSSGSNADALLDQSEANYWESNSSSRPHWIEVTIPQDLDWTEFSVYTKEHESYSPNTVRVKCGDKLIKEFSLPHIASQWVTLMNIAEAEEKLGHAVVQSSKTLRLEILSCHSGGCNTRVTSIRLLGLPKGFRASKKNSNTNQIKSQFASILPGSALSDACDEIVELVSWDLHSHDHSVLISESDRNKLTLLFSFAVLRNSLAGLLEVVSLMLSFRISLSSSVVPFLRYFNHTVDSSESYFSKDVGSALSQAQDIMRALETLSDVFPILSHADVSKILNFIHVYSSKNNQLGDICASAEYILGENIRRVQTAIPIEERYRIIDKDNRVRLQSLLDNIIDDTSRDPSSDRVSSGAVALYSISKDIFIPNCEQQIAIALEILHSMEVSMGRRSFAVAILMEMDVVVFLHWLQSTEAIQNLVQALLSILDKSIQDQIKSGKIVSLTSTQMFISRTLDRVAYYYAGTLKKAISSTSADKSLLKISMERLVSLLQQMLNSAKRHMECIAATGRINDATTLAAFESIVGNSFITNLLPLVLFDVHNTLEEFKNELNVEQEFFVHFNSTLREIGSPFSLPFVSIECLSTVFLSFRLFVLKQSVTTTKKIANEKVKGEEYRAHWLGSPLFSHGLLDADNSSNSSELNLMMQFLDAPESDEVKKIVSILRKHVRSDRSGSDPHVNHAVHATCAVMIWHHGMAPEVLALAEDRRAAPSAQLIKVWEIAQKMRTYLDEGELRKSLTQANDDMDEDDVDAASLSSPDTPDSVIQAAASDSVIARSRALLKLTSATVVRSSTEAHEKKLWQNAAAVARMKLLPKPDSGKQKMSTVAKTVTADQELHNSIALKRYMLQRAKEEKSTTVAESILQFLQARLNLVKLFEEVKQRDIVASYRASSFETMKELVMNEVSTQKKIKILRTIVEALHSYGDDVHFLAGLAGASRSEVAAVESMWAALNRLIITLSLKWIDECDCDEGKSMDAYRAIVVGLNVLIQDFRPSDLHTIKEIGLIPLLSKLSSCSHMALRNLALKCAGFVIHRCCITDRKAEGGGAFLLEKATQSEIEDASRTLLPALIEVVQAHIDRAASSIGRVIESTNAVVDSKWILQKCVVTDPHEPGFVIQHFPIPTTHSFSFWLWRPSDEVLDGTIFVKSGPHTATTATTGSPSTPILNVGTVNRAFVTMTAGEGCKMYCGRRLGVEAIPDSDGRCGPTNGPQCSDCNGFLSSTPLCSNGHTMSLFLNLQRRVCDVCDLQLNSVKFLYNCSSCNYDLCPSCSVASISSVVPQKAVPKMAVPPWGSIAIKFKGGLVSMEVSPAYSVSSSLPFPVAKWTHVTYVVDVDKKGVKLYFDGSLVAEKDLIDTLAIVKEDTNNHPYYIGQSPSFASIERAAHCAVTNTTVTCRSVDVQEINHIMATTTPSYVESPMGISSRVQCSNAEVVGMIGALSRVGKSLQADKGKGIDRLLSHDILSPLLLLMFHGYSETIRVCAAKATCQLIPHASLEVVRTIFAKMGFKELQSDAASIFEVMLELYGSYLNPFLRDTNSNQPRSSTFAHHLHMLLKAMFDGCGEWVDDVRGVIQKLIEEAPATLLLHLDCIRQEQQGIELSPDAIAFLSGRGMNRLIGWLAFFGDWYAGIFPGDKVLFQGKSMSLLEEHVVLSYSDRDVFGEAFKLIPVNRTDKEIRPEYAQASSISPDKVQRVRSTSKAVQQAIVDYAGKILTAVKIILTAHFEEVSAHATLLFSMVKLFAIDTISNLSDCMKVREFKETPSFSSAMTAFSSTLQQCLLVDIVAFKLLTGTALDTIPVSCYDNLTKLLQAFRNGNYGFAGVSSVDKDKRLRTKEEVQQMIENLGGAVAQTNGDSSVHDPSTSSSSVDSGTVAKLSEEITKSLTIKVGKKYTIDDGDIAAAANTASSKKKIVNSKITYASLQLSQPAAHALTKALADSIIFKSYKLLCQINNIVHLRESSLDLATVDYGQLYMLLKIAGLGQIGPPSPLLQVMFSNIGHISSSFVSVCKAMFSYGLAYIDDDSAWIQFLSSNRKSNRKSDAVFEQNSSGLIELREDGTIVKFIGEKVYSMVSVTMDSGIWEWELECIEDKNGDETSFVGVCRKSTTNGNYDSSPDLWVLRCYSGQTYNCGSENHSGRVGNRPLSKVHPRDVVTFTYNVSEQTLALKVNDTDHGVIFSGIGQGEDLVPIVGYYGSGSTKPVWKLSRIDCTSTNATAPVTVDSSSLKDGDGPRNLTMALTLMSRIIDMTNESLDSHILDAMEKCTRFAHKLPVNLLKIALTIVSKIFNKLRNEDLPNATVKAIGTNMIKFLHTVIDKGLHGIANSQLFQAIVEAAVIVANKLDVTIFENEGSTGSPSSLTFESPHPYPNNSNTYTPVVIPGATGYEVSFSSLTVTENNHDYVRFYKDDSHSQFWGEEKYTGGRSGQSKNYPGTDGRPPLHIPASRFVLHFHSDSSDNDWGYKINVDPILPGILSPGERKIRNSINTLGRLNKTLLALRGGTGATAAIDNSLLQYVREIVQKRYSSTSSKDLLAKRWAEFSVFADGFVQYPTLAAVVTHNAKVEPKTPISAQDTSLTTPAVKIERKSGDSTVLDVGNSVPAETHTAVSGEVGISSATIVDPLTLLSESERVTVTPLLNLGIDRSVEEIVSAFLTVGKNVERAASELLEGRTFPPISSFSSSSPAKTLFGTVVAPGTLAAPLSSSSSALFGAAFGAPASTSTSGLLFGAPVSPPSAVFGAPAASVSSSSAPFGAAVGAPASTSSALFGAPVSPPSAAPAVPAVFGAPAASVSSASAPFGAPASTSSALFGAPVSPPSAAPAVPAASSAPFGAPAFTSGSLFGAPVSPPSTAFGASAASASSSGSSSAPFGAPVPALATASAAPAAAFGVFASTSPFGAAFGSSAPGAPFGSGASAVAYPTTPTAFGTSTVLSSAPIVAVSPPQGAPAAFAASASSPSAAFVISATSSAPSSFGAAFGAPISDLFTSSSSSTPFGAAVSPPAAPAASVPLGASTSTVPSNTLFGEPLWPAAAAPAFGLPAPPSAALTFAPPMVLTPNASSQSGHHKGLMACRCGHQLGNVPFPLQDGIVHLMGSCTWMCCNLDWSDDICTVLETVAAPAFGAPGMSFGSPVFGASTTNSTASSGGPKSKHKKGSDSKSKGRGSGGANTAGTNKVVFNDLQSDDVLTARFALISQLNNDLVESLDMIDLSLIEQSGSIANNLNLCRRYILSCVKSDLITAGFSSTERSGSQFQLTLSRMRALKYAKKGECDLEGRWSVFGQAFRSIHGLPSSSLRRKEQLWTVIFVGEHSQDAGGPYRESWSTMCQELMSASLPLLKPSPNATIMVGINRDTWVLNPDATSVDQAEMFKFLGKLMGIAARSQLYLDLNLAPMVWKLIVREPVTLEDYRGIDSIGASFIEKIRGGSTEDKFEMEYGDMTFTVTSLGGTEVELHPGGQNEILTWANRLQYCEELERFHLAEMSAAAEAIYSGLCTQFPKAVLSLIRGDELERMVCGVAEVDVDLLKSATDYSGYSGTDRVVLLFWEVLKEFSHDDRRAFLRFTWSRSRLPLNLAGFKQRMKVSKLDRSDPDASLPVSHTCSFQLDLPNYTNKESIRQKLTYAIHNCIAIDGDDTSAGMRAAAMAIEEDF